MFKDNDDVCFGDVNLSQEQIRGDHNPGSGGWPTIRYFNKETGYGGGAYTRKKSGPVCDELGDVKYMQAYVEEYGSTSLCSIADGKGCSEKEQKYIGKWKLKSAEDVEKQKTRLQGLSESSMTDELKTWVNQRLAVIKQFSKANQAAVKTEL